MTSKYGMSELLAQLKLVGIEQGDSIIVHTSMKSLGWISGGERAVITALCTAVGEDGNVVMPSQTPELSDPSTWTEDPAPEAEWDDIRDSIMGYDKMLTPVIGQGRVAELFRTYPNVLRTEHPLDSFSVWGKDADEIATLDNYDFPFGDDGVLGKLYKHDAKIVMIGTDFETNTSIHLAESRLNRDVTTEIAPVEVGSFLEPQKQLIEFKNVALDRYENFKAIETAFLNTIENKRSIKLNNGELRTFSMRDCVDFAFSYLKKLDAEQTKKNA
ncbi:AAC(3) family N-acetyltransferase [Periweissella cryptocerci]|uniref:Aminoglycoside N(3)-acetyltransferase n=1 Tax=Periweissella cryptocerci TaxID=2506420 RepID=A0A4P6YWD3_9LACO|nr:AAC(3) family N-acetyltransferase [Periweissella cryptocerci]QBO37199.1 AAC(3) family N-acetyltransferase [Periweissella cryptocerci]